MIPVDTTILSILLVLFLVIFLLIKRSRKKKEVAGRDIRYGLQKTRNRLFDSLNRILSRRAIDDELKSELEEVLISADIGVKTTENLLNNLIENTKKASADKEFIKNKLKEEIYKVLQKAENSFDVSKTKPYIILTLGVNGVGKTTTIAKIAHKYKMEGKSVMLAAADTFRAAAREQLEVWAERIGISVIAGSLDSDPSAVVFDAVQAAQSRNIALLIIDTAGRLHTKVNLIKELGKVKKVIEKVIPEGANEVLLIIDATTGQNAILQARDFNNALGVTGIAMSKLDGTAKGGILIHLVDEFNIPIRFLGTGEKLEDLKEFTAREFVDALF